MKVIRKSVTKCETKERSKCRKWRLRVTTDHEEQSRRFTGTYTQAKAALELYVEDIVATPEELSSFGSYAKK